MIRPSLVLVHSPVLGPASVQATARALSELGWICIVPSLTDAGSVDEHVAAAAAGVADGSVVIAHSGAGPLVPAIAAAARGRVPRWSQWWGEETFAALAPQIETADGMRTEMRRLPLEFFRAEVPVHAGWPETPCAYLQLSEAYASEAMQAQARGWTVARVDGSHLDSATRPAETAAALDRLLEQLP